MISEVRVYDPSGNLKKTITEQEILVQQWRKIKRQMGEIFSGDNNPKYREERRLKNKLELKKCEYCKKDFQPSHSLEIYCPSPTNSKKDGCKYKKYSGIKKPSEDFIKPEKVSKNLICALCGNEFKPIKVAARRMFCSAPCNYDLYARFLRKKKSQTKRIKRKLDMIKNVELKLI